MARTQARGRAVNSRTVVRAGRAVIRAGRGRESHRNVVTSGVTRNVECAEVRGFNNIFNNGPVWTNLRKFFFYDGYSNDLIFDEKRSILKDTTHSTAFEYVAPDDNPLTIQQFIPFVVEWIFGKRNRGWIMEFRKKTVLERVENTMVYLQKFVNARSKPEGNFLNTVPIQELNIGHLILSTVDEIFDYATVRNVELHWKNGNKLEEDEIFSASTQDFEPLYFVELFRDWFIKLNRLMKGDGFSSDYIRGIFEERRKKSKVITDKEWKAVHRKFFTAEFPRDYPDPWKDGSILRVGNEWLNTTQLGLIAFSDPIISDWPASLIRELEKAVQPNSIAVDIENNVQNIKDIAGVTVMENWFFTLPVEAGEEQFWKKFSKRQIFEIFLASDIRVRAGVHNADGSVFKLLYDAINVERCLMSLMWEYIKLRRSKNEMGQEFEIGSLDDWFQTTWPEHSKDVTTLSMSIPECIPDSFNYKSIFPRASNAYTRAASHNNSQIVPAEEITLPSQTRKRNNELRTNLIVGSTQSKRRSTDNSNPTEITDSARMQIETIEQIQSEGTGTIATQAYTADNTLNNQNEQQVMGPATAVIHTNNEISPARTEGRVISLLSQPEIPVNTGTIGTEQQIRPPTSQTLNPTFINSNRRNYQHRSIRNNNEQRPATNTQGNGSRGISAPPLWGQPGINTVEVNYEPRRTPRRGGDISMEVRTEQVQRVVNEVQALRNTGRNENIPPLFVYGSNLGLANPAVPPTYRFNNNIRNDVQQQNNNFQPTRTREWKELLKSIYEKYPSLSTGTFNLPDTTFRWRVTHLLNQQMISKILLYPVFVQDTKGNSIHRQNVLDFRRNFNSLFYSDTNFRDLGGERSQQVSDRKLFTVMDYFSSVLDECTKSIFESDAMYLTLSTGLVFSMGSYFGYCADAIAALMADEFYRQVWYGNYKLVVATIQLIRDLKTFNRFFIGCKSNAMLFQQLNAAFAEGSYDESCIREITQVWNWMQSDRQGDRVMRKNINEPAEMIWKEISQFLQIRNFRLDQLIPHHRLFEPSGFISKIQWSPDSKYSDIGLLVYQSIGKVDDLSLCVYKNWSYTEVADHWKPYKINFLQFQLQLLNDRFETSYDPSPVTISRVPGPVAGSFVYRLPSNERGITRSRRTDNRTSRQTRTDDSNDSVASHTRAALLNITSTAYNSENNQQTAITNNQNLESQNRTAITSSVLNSPLNVTESTPQLSLTSNNISSRQEIIPDHHPTAPIAVTDFLKSWFDHTSRILPNSMRIWTDEDPRGTAWRNNTSVMRVIPNNSLCIVLVRNACRFGTLALPTEAPPTYRRLNEDIYCALLCVKNDITGSQMGATVLGIIMEDRFRGNHEGPSISGYLSFEETYQMECPEYFLVPKSRQMGGIVTARLANCICNDTTPLLESLIVPQVSITTPAREVQRNESYIQQPNTQPPFQDQQQRTQPPLHDQQQNIQPSFRDQQPSVQPHLRDQQPSAQPFFREERSNRTIMDLNGTEHGETTLKLNQSNFIVLEEVAVIARQFADESTRITRLGNYSNSFIPFQNFFQSVLSNSVDPAAVIRLHTIFDTGSIEKFRSATMWNWGVPNGITLQLFSSCETITTLSDVVAAIENFETFLEITFGAIWSNCTLLFRQECRRHTVVILPAKYVQCVFERVCTRMYNKLREQMAPDQLEFGKFWVDKFINELTNVEMNIVNELEWEGQQRMRDRLTRNLITPPSTKPKIDLLVNRKEDQICFPFLRLLLGNNDSGCNKKDCPRIHDDIKQWKKSEIRESLKTVYGSADMLAALETSNLFNN